MKRPHALLVTSWIGITKEPKVENFFRLVASFNPPEAPLHQLLVQISSIGRSYRFAIHAMP